MVVLAILLLLVTTLSPGGLILSIQSTFAEEPSSGTWLCREPDGTELYSNRKLGDHCRRLTLPPLMRSPAPPTSTEETPRRHDERQPPGPERRNVPPPKEVIDIRDLRATPNFNSILGIAQYHATMRVTNRDGEWTAETLCLNVRFQDVSRIFVDVHETDCLKNLQPLESRTVSIIYTGMIPPRLFPIDATVAIETVEWTR